VAPMILDSCRVINLTGPGPSRGQHGGELPGLAAGCAIRGDAGASACHCPGRLLVSRRPSKHRPADVRAERPGPDRLVLMRVTCDCSPCRSADRYGRVRSSSRTPQQPAVVESADTTEPAARKRRSAIAKAALMRWMSAQLRLSSCADRLRRASRSAARSNHSEVYPKAAR
jgi:hypothetical protein